MVRRTVDVVFDFLDFTLDPQRGELLRAGSPVALEPKALALLTLLLARRGELATKQELLDALWPGTPVSEGALTRLVSLARAALGGRDGGAEVIRTRHRRGYQVVVPVRIRSSTLHDLERGTAIAVLRLESEGDDPEARGFADGLVQDLITGLARIGEVPVIGRHSAFAYHRTGLDIRRVARELRAGFVVEGSIRRAGTAVRVRLELIHAETGYHLWSDRYDGSLAAIFACQDRMVASACDAIGAALRCQRPISAPDAEVGDAGLPPFSETRPIRPERTSYLS